MIVLVPWKPVVAIWLLSSAMPWCGYFGFSLLEGKNPFAPYTIQEPAIPCGRCVITNIRRNAVNPLATIELSPEHPVVER